MGEFVKHKGDSKALYNLVSKLTGTENTNILPDKYVKHKVTVKHCII